MKRLSKAIGIVLDHLPQGGRPSMETRDSLFVLLAKLYETRSGAQFKYPDKRIGFQSSNFVRGIAQIINPELTHDDCERALKAAVQILRAEQNLEKPA